MHKLPEAPDRERGDAYIKKGNHLSKRKETCTFSVVSGETTTLKIFLAADGKLNEAVFKRHAG